MPDFLLGKTLAYYFNGYNFSGHYNKYDYSLKVDQLDNTGFGPNFHRTAQPGNLETEINMEGWYSHTVAPDVSGLVNQLQAAIRVNTPCMACMPGSSTAPVADDECDLWITTAIDRKLGVEQDQLVTLSSTFTSSTGVHSGKVMFAESAFVGAPFSSVGYDFWGSAQSTTRTFIVVLQVTSYTSGLAAVLVQTSDDNSSWNTRGTFPAISAVGGYALQITAEFDRYIRIRDTGAAIIIGGVAVVY